MPKKLDLTNQRFGRLVAIKEGPRNSAGRTTWICKCDCGNEKIIATTQLTCANTQSCGCLQKERTRQANQSKSLVGQKYGRLTVIKRLPNSSKWECLCECGNTIITDTNHLNQGNTQSCGCYQKDRTRELFFKNLTGQRFGMLTVKSLDTTKSTSKEKFYICQCDCGQEKSIRQTGLMSGTLSCGCLRISRGEFKIAELLKSYNIPFTTEHSFETCVNPKTNKKLRFDFFVNNSYLIEYNGKQHYHEEDGWNEPLEDIQYRDNIKIEWAKKHNIPLIIIPYTKYDTLTIDDLLPLMLAGGANPFAAMTPATPQTNA